MIIGVLGVAAPVLASFHASDLIYIPAVAHNEGLEGSFWRTDLYITNVDDVDIDILLVYLPSGLVNNFNVFNDRTLWLGGRSSEGVGSVNEALADIPPDGTVILEDVVGTYWPEQLAEGGLGALVIFAHEAGSLDDDGNRVFRNAVVMSRTYNQTTVYQPDPDNEGEFLEVPATFGQTVPGVPWYNLADPAAVSEELGDFSFQILTGGTENQDFRYNVGVLNASDPQTLLTVTVQPFQPSGEPFLDELDNPQITTITMPPLSHFQWTQILRSIFGLEDVEQVMMKVSILRWSSTSDSATPALTSYGSVIDAVTNDATTVLPSFASPFNVECMFPSEKRAIGDGMPRVTARPLRVPPTRTTSN
jgi:hypothetical protein